jgi:hypothetical protein
MSEARDPQSHKEVLEFAMAHYHALKIAVFVLLDSHPDPALVLPHFDKMGETIKSGYLNSGLSDLAIADFERELASFRKRLELRKAGLAGS